MSSKFLVRGVLAAVAVSLALPASAAVWPPANLTAFTDACRAHPGLQGMVAGQPDSGGAPIERLCTCFAGRLQGVSQEDADMLTKDLLGTATDAERQAYASYDSLSGLASSSLDACVASVGAPGQPEGPVADAPVTPEPAPPISAPIPAPAPEVAVTPPAPAPAPETQTATADPAPVPAPQPQRMSASATGFLGACVGSGPFNRYLSRMHSGDASPQGGICSCLTGTLVEKVADSDLPVLAEDFFDNRKASTRGEGYAAIATLAQDSLRTCMQDAGVEPGF